MVVSLGPSPPSRSRPPPPLPLCAQGRRPLWTWEGAVKKGCRQCEAFPALFLLLPRDAPGWRHERTWTGNPETWFQGDSLGTVLVSIGQFSSSGNHFFIQPTGSWVAFSGLSSCPAGDSHPSLCCSPLLGQAGSVWGLGALVLSLFPFEILA